MCPWQAPCVIGVRGGAGPTELIRTRDVTGTKEPQWHEHYNVRMWVRHPRKWRWQPCSTRELRVKRGHPDACPSSDAVRSRTPCPDKMRCDADPRRAMYRAVRSAARAARRLVLRTRWTASSFRCATTATASGMRSARRGSPSPTCPLVRALALWTSNALHFGCVSRTRASCTCQLEQQNIRHLHQLRAQCTDHLHAATDAPCLQAYDWPHVSEREAPCPQVRSSRAGSPC